LEERELAKLRELLSQLRGLVRSPAWDRLCEFAREQIANRQNEVNAPLGDAGRIYQQEFMKGELAGIKLFTEMPQMIVDDLEVQLQPYQENTNG
jgi:hypothetical protein